MVLEDESQACENRLVACTNGLKVSLGDGIRRLWAKGCGLRMG